MCLYFDNNIQTGRYTWVISETGDKSRALNFPYHFHITLVVDMKNSLGKFPKCLAPYKV